MDIINTNLKPVLIKLLPPYYNKLTNGNNIITNPDLSNWAHSFCWI
jgi:hypothetical protein